MSQQNLRFTFEAHTTTEEHQSPPSFDVVAFHLTEALSDTFKLEVELASFDDQIDFAHLLDQPALFTIWQDGIAVRQVHGLISDLYQGDTGFRRTRYHAVVEPQLARLQLCSDWRIFQRLTAVEIVQAILKANHLTSHTVEARHEHIAREYCVQAGTTDFGFVQRLLAEEGFVYRFGHGETAHQLLMTDVIQSFGAMTEEHNQDDMASVLYQPNPGGDSPRPALRKFSYCEHVRTARQTQRDYTFKNPRYTQEHHSYGHDSDHQSSEYEQYRYPGQYKQDAAGAPFTQTRLLSIRNDARIAQATGDDARIELGKAFQLVGHSKQNINISWRPVSIEHRGTQHTSVEEEAATAEQGTRYEQVAQLVPATANWKAPIPEMPFLKGPFIAHVTGPCGEELYTDEFGRVKVIFPWDRYNGAHEYSSCWVRVAQNWAGVGWGHMALPRIGQEVIVDFLGADESQPIITGRAYDAEHPTPYKLPALKTLATIKSKEHKGGGYNELLIDDTTGEIKTQLHSTHGATQLTMGYLTHPRTRDGSAKHRGNGFELRTDEWGAIRAAKGLYISTDAREQAQGKQLDLQEAINQLQNALNLAQSLAQATQTANGLPVDVENQQKQLDEVYTNLQKAGMLASAPEGVAITTPQSAQVSAENNISLTAAQNIDASTAKDYRVAAGDNISLFTVDLDIKVIANKGQVQLQAQHNAMEITAQNNIDITSTQNDIELAAKGDVILKCSGGAYIKLSGGDVEIGCPGKIIYKAASMQMIGPAADTTKLPEFELVDFEHQAQVIGKKFYFSG